MPTTQEESIFDRLLKTHYEFLEKNPPAKELKVAPSTFKRLNIYFEDEQAERERQGIKSIPKENVWLTNLYGINVIVDPEMEPGTWKFVS